MRQSFLIIFIVLSTTLGYTQALTNTANLNITKSWPSLPPETPNYTYNTGILVPNGPVPQDGFPVCILLHGNTGNGPAMVQQFRNIITCHILVAPTGYEGSWDITDEESEGPDVLVVNELIDTLQTFSNINPNQIRILGFSNGAALTNRLFIENKKPGVDKMCAVVSQLSEAQYRDGTFYRPNGPTGSELSNNGYNVPSAPLTGRQYLSICNTNDPIIPYTGGPSVVDADFLDAQESTFRVAESQGYTGSQLPSSGDSIADALYEYSYLNGDVVHLKGEAAHGMSPDQEAYIVAFFEDCATITGFENTINKSLQLFPNPTNSSVMITGNFEIGSSYEVISGVGQTLLSGSTYSNHEVIDLSGLSPDLYYIKVAGQSTKIIKTP